MKLILSILICLAAGGIAGYVTAGQVNGEWYTALVKPSFQPPNWLFGPVWTTLYILMGIALWLVWKTPSTPDRNTAITIFFIQLVLNFLWSLIFFNGHAIGFALIDIVTLWIMIVLTIFAFSRISKTASWLLVPYISWVSFATILNWTIWNLNKPA